MYLAYLYLGIFVPWISVVPSRLVVPTICLALQILFVLFVYLEFPVRILVSKLLVWFLCDGWLHGVLCHNWLCLFSLTPSNGIIGSVLPGNITNEALCPPIWVFSLCYFLPLLRPLCCLFVQGLVVVCVPFLQICVGPVRPCENLCKEIPTLLLMLRTWRFWWSMRSWVQPHCWPDFMCCRTWKMVPRYASVFGFWEIRCVSVDGKDHVTRSKYDYGIRVCCSVI